MNQKLIRDELRANGFIFSMGAGPLGKSASCTVVPQAGFRGSGF